jgi:hypothetical protein
MPPDSKNTYEVSSVDEKSAESVLISKISLVKFVETSAAVRQEALDQL